MKKYFYLGVLGAGIISCSLFFYSYSIPPQKNQTISHDNLLAKAQNLSETSPSLTPEELNESKEVLVKSQEDSVPLEEDFISNELQKALNNEIDYSDGGPLEQVKELFPEISGQIDAYQTNVYSHNQTIKEFKGLAEYKNQLLRNGQTVPKYLDYEMEAKRDGLMLAAQALGKEAMEVNAAIRRQANAARLSKD
ncbi:hypothetical protein ACJJH9_02980 [Microbulbifer sp. DLAB2-AF]|uniref:hypothetical protein n=1 Tax=Microbulbifer sp. DLAB2-AF TaxID=3243395 RepID=UPI00403A2A03